MMKLSSVLLAGLFAFVSTSAVSGQPQMLRVSPDGANGAYKTVQAAIDALPAGLDEPRLIVIAAGSYKELIRVPKNKSKVTLRGEDGDPAKTILTYDLYADYVAPGTTQPIGTSGTASTVIEGNDFTAENLTFANTAGEKGQAVAIKILGDRGVYRNCRFLGWQDTLYVDEGRHYFLNCYIQGRVDFIFGGATAIFDRCTIHSNNGGYITAARTRPEQQFGFVFLDCTLTGEGAPAYLGRPWQWDRGRNAAVSFVRTKIGPHIRPEGWNQWDRPNNPNTQPAKTARYSEYGSVDADGKPIDVSTRVPWSHQLTAEQAAELTVQKVLAGSDNWNPTKAEQSK
jgi:pectinesterase